MGVNVKTTRPDLSFITSQNFKNIKEFDIWFDTLNPIQVKCLINVMYLGLPNLVACAEMLFDCNLEHIDSPIFQIASETLNKK